MKEIMEKIKRPFKAEVKSGCLNTSVFGGFDQYILNHLDQLKKSLINTAPDILPLVGQIKLLFLDYKRIMPEERQQILRQVIPLVQELDLEIQQVLDGKVNRSEPLNLGEGAEENLAGEQTYGARPRVDSKREKVKQTPLLEVPSLEKTEVKSLQGKKLVEMPNKRKTAQGKHDQDSQSAQAEEVSQVAFEDTAPEGPDAFSVSLDLTEPVGQMEEYVLDEDLAGEAVLGSQESERLREKRVDNSDETESETRKVEHQQAEEMQDGEVLADRKEAQAIQGAESQEARQRAQVMQEDEVQYEDSGRSKVDLKKATSGHKGSGKGKEKKVRFAKPVERFEETDDIPDPLAVLDHLEELAGSVQYIKGIGPKRAKVLQKVDVENIMDLLYYLPREYSDRSEVIPISDLTDFEQEVTIVGKVVSVQEVRPRRGMKIVKVGIHDGTGLAFGVWFNQPYIKNQFNSGDKVIFSGKVNQKNYNRYRRIELSNPIYENLNMEEHVHTRRIVPIYPLTDGLNQKNVREMIKNAIDSYIKKMPDLIPMSLRQKFNLFSIEDALNFIHFPENKALLDEAKRRLIFEDFFLLQLGILFQRQSNRTEKESYPCREDRELLKAFRQILPFSLTGAQERVWGDISTDLEKTRPMYRLLQGDVGSGKTVIAAMTLMKGIENGLQGALMAPTEILAEQHYLSLKNWFDALDLRVALLTGSLKKKAREEILARLVAGEIDLLIGTHALIQEWVEFKKLGVVVIDEQHRFGVKQRESLRNKGQIHPHVLVMTATPIPRSMALTIYGDLDLSIIDELPPGRKPIKTVWRGAEARDKIYEFVKEQLDEGRQAYVVCPLVEESELMDVESATEMAEHLASSVFYQYQVGLLTGQTQKDEREGIMQAFRSGELDILVSTTVIEVGVDVPNANIMIIEDAQRFGLAQLHQLRGRVGRGQAQSYCILIGDATTPEGERRLEVMVETNDGFRIAEEDLAIRGPGEFFGTRQHGLPEFKVASLIRDWEMLELVREEVQALLKEKPNWIPNELLRIVLAMRFKGGFLMEDPDEE